MQVRLVSGLKYGDAVKRGVVEVSGSVNPRLDEKLECIDMVTKLADDGWVIAADLRYPIGRLAKRATEGMGATFLSMNSPDIVTIRTQILGKRLMPSLD